jgi:hypothetical protein
LAKSWDRADDFVIGVSLLSLFGRDGHQPTMWWGKRVAGIPLLVAGILLVLGLLL